MWSLYNTILHRPGTAEHEVIVMELTQSKPDFVQMDSPTSLEYKHFSQPPNHGNGSYKLIKAVWYFHFNAHLLFEFV